MGNSLNSETADWNEETMKAKTTELKKQIEVVDHSMTGLAKSIDSMQVACKMLLLHQDKKEDNQDSFQVDELKEESQSGVSLARELLRYINDSVTDHKFIALECLCKMIHLIENTIYTTGVLTKESEVELALDTYLDAKLPYDREEKVSYYDKKIESLSTEVRKLMDIKRCLHNRIEIKESRESTLNDEINILQKEVERLGKKLNLASTETKTLSNKDGHKEVEDKLISQTNKLADMTTKFQDQEKELEEVKKEKEELICKTKKLANMTTQFQEQSKELDDVKKELVKLKDEKVKFERENGTRMELNRNIGTKIEQVEVQIHRKRTRTFLERSFIDLLETKAKAKSLKLDIVVCYTRNSINRNKPLLIVCEADSATASSTRNEEKVEGVEATKNAALVVFHSSKNKWIPIKHASTWKHIHPYSCLGGIFDVVCYMYTSMHNCPDNDSAMDGIVNFIYEKFVAQTHTQRKDEFLQR